MKNVLGVISMIVMILSFFFSIILLIVFPTEPMWIIFFGVSVLFAITFFIISLFEENDDYNYGYDDGKKETTNEEKKPFIVKLKTTCPHCGAPMKDDTCAYCGSKSEIYKVIL